MQFEELKKEVEVITYVELRENSENYLEAVISSSELLRLKQKLETFFGAPYSLSWESLSREAKEAIGGLGGVGAGQTLYLRSNDNEIAFAMLWPWQGGKQITVKVSHRVNK